MTALLLKEELSTDALIEEVKEHPAYRPEINSKNEAIMALQGFAPYTYMIRKGESLLSFYVSHVTDQHTIYSNEFVIDPDKLSYQFWNNSTTGKRYSNSPYFLNFYSDLDEMIIEACLECNKFQAQTMV